MRMNVIICLAAASIACLFPVSVIAGEVTVDQQVLQQLKETIQQQQHQLQQQAEQIRQQADHLQQLQQQVSRLLQQTTAPSSPPVPAIAAQQARPETAPPLALPLVVMPGNDKVRLALSGQINRALNVIGDGGGTRLYHVDNNVSNSRIRLIGKSELDGELTLGTRLELAFTADESSKVSQKEPAPGNYLNTRWVDISLTSKSYGKLSLGKGNTASYCTAASDFSKTDIILYSSVADIAGGIMFREKNGRLTDTALADVFTDFDGLNTKSRLRYDTPTFKGFSLAGSLVSNQRSDLGVFWEGEGYGFQVGASFGLANPRISDSGLQYDGSLSLLHTATGLNATFSSGMLEKKGGSNPSSFYTKLGWLTERTVWGYTAFGVDYARSDNIQSSGDRGISVGAAVVQEIRKIAAEVYTQYRIYSLKMGSGVKVDDINVGTIGVRVKF